MGLLDTIEKIEKRNDFVSRNKKALWIYKITEDFTYHSGIKTQNFDSKWLRINEMGDITIKANYAWDGCSFKISVFDLFILGTPDGIINIETMKPKTYYASLVHDALYQYLYYHSLSRKEADRIFYALLKESNFCLSWLYFFVVRSVAWIFFIKKRIQMKKARSKK